MAGRLTHGRLLQRAGYFDAAGGHLLDEVDDSHVEEFGGLPDDQETLCVCLSRGGDVAVGCFSHHRSPSGNHFSMMRSARSSAMAIRSRLLVASPTSGARTRHLRRASDSSASSLM